ncbi:MAG: acyl-CoA dehydrogenase family protein [Deltaproteobacteria bacterium]|nr:acyl-CoA dehydrogenase family protein [Deltaproteobacteria bacterium]MBW2053473.1 acyl-CoA dehydrogenase family protein [Deltaproteobacteria bacterium]MBW2142051.1 acyl-CoA dehydrogenase family protein [Deltaproteobacteria bacterium]MBW2323800.1 acyl-CoA dehydrogenase family protein [Deltaproteobacteria bacterium]
MIDFEIAPLTKAVLKKTRDFGENFSRKIARHYDEYEYEHDELTDEQIKEITAHQAEILEMMKDTETPREKLALSNVMTGEVRSWGDQAVLSGATKMGLGNAAINAVATDDQKKRFGHLFAAMAITEPGAGSDTASISTTAKLDEETNEWVLNGEKIFVTSGRRCKAVVIWATLDKSIGRAAIKSFVVEKDRPGITVTKNEKKLGIRASDTVSILLEDCRIPFDNILGSPEIKEKKKGLGGAMATFDATRPGVAAGAVGISQAALDFTKAKLEEEGYTFPYDRGLHSLSAIQRDILEMEANLEASRLLIWRASGMMDQGVRNSKEASMCKAKSGKAATLVCQKCVAMLGPLGYSREWLVEKWMRDCKITDLYEGTGQINTLIVARQILGFSRHQLK